MKIQKYLFVILIIALVGCTATKLSKPLKNIDFSGSNWLMIYVERTNNGSENQKNKIWIIHDKEAIPSLKEEFACAEKLQGDGKNEFLFYLYQDNQYNKAYIFNNKANFSLGGYQKYLKKVSAFDITCPNLKAAQATSDSLNHLNVSNVYHAVKESKFINLNNMDISSFTPESYVVTYFK
jgi:hypothetical protein